MPSVAAGHRICKAGAKPFTPRNCRSHQGPAILSHLHGAAPSSRAQSAPTRCLERLMQMTPLIAIHLSAALAAVALGPLALWARKGRTQRPRLHRAFGYAWVTLMLATAVTAIFIRDYRLPNIAGYTPIHLLVPITLVSLGFAFWFLVQGNVERSPQDHAEPLSGCLYRRWRFHADAGPLSRQPGARAMARPDLTSSTFRPTRPRPCCSISCSTTPVNSSPSPATPHDGSGSCWQAC